MKKQYLAVAFLAVALGITACSSKKADTESTTAQEVESTEATSDEEVEGRLLLWLCQPGRR